MRDWIKVIAAFFVLLLVATFLGMVYSVISAPARVVNKTLQTDNIIFNYERFFDMKSQYDARVAQLKESERLLRSSSVSTDESNMILTELRGQRQSCRELANQYNNDAIKLNKSLFMDKNLPTSLDTRECEAFV